MPDQRQAGAKPINALVVGLGDIGMGYDFERLGDRERVTTHAKACLTHPGVRLVGGVDRDDTRGKRFEEFAQSSAFTSLEVAREVLGPSSVDLLIVATPTATHLNLLREGVAAFDPRVVLLEKPLAHNLTDAREIVGLCQRKGIMLAVNYFRRYCPAMCYVRQMIQKGDWGRLVSGTCHYYGGLLNIASHFVDLLDFFFQSRLSGAVPLDLMAGQHQAADGDWKGLYFSVSVDDHPVCFMPVVADYQLCEMDLMFERGRIVIDESNPNQMVSVYGVKDDSGFKGYRRLCREPVAMPPVNRARYQYDVLAGVVRELAVSQRPASDGCSALTTLQHCLDVVP